MRPPDPSHISGQQLYGNDFSQDEIDEWFRDEKEAYADLIEDEDIQFSYPYHAVNWYHGFRHLPDRQFNRILGFGSAYGDELEPVIGKTNRITILDPSDKFATIRELKGKPVEFVKPVSSGVLPFEDNSFDLITCFGVLHHIPNVEFVISECARCLTPDGFLLVREPMVSMGDWGRPRRGLTKHERGIPVGLLRDFVRQAGLQTVREAYCFLLPFSRLLTRLGVSVYSSRWATWMDYRLCQMTAFNARYHRKRISSKFAPAPVFMVLKRPKPEEPGFVRL